MRQKFLTARGGITALFVILFSLCLALGVLFAVPEAVYADEETGGNEEAGGETEGGDYEDEWGGENAWIINPILAGWTEGEFNKDVNVVSANPRYGADEMYFRIFGYQTVGDTEVFMPYMYSDGVHWEDDKVDRAAFRLTGDDRSIPDYVIDVISEFEAGTYYLFAVVPATDSYTGLNTNVSDAGTGEEIKAACSPFKVLVKSEYNGLSITEWEWGTYDYRVNTINADISVDESLKVSYSVLSYDNKRIEGLSAFSIDAAGRVIEPNSREAFKALPAGDYWLVASDNAHGSEEPYRVAFKVSPYSNSWITSPSIEEWTWGEYNLNVNLIVGSAQRNESGLVYFGIYTDEDTAYSDNLARFTVGESKVVNVAIAEELKVLPAGDYLLKCWIENDNPNYVDLSETVAFTVKQIPNYWEVSPYVLSWKYGDFDRQLNIIRSEAVLGTKTQYAIYKDEDCTQAVMFGGNEWFELEKGLVPESVEAVLKTVDAGTYYLKCLVTNDNPNYAELSETVPFAVLKVLNSWVVAPSIISWNEGRFNDADNVLSGTAKVGSVRFSIYDDKDNLLYIIYKSEEGLITSVTNPEGASLHISVLNKLPVGSYKMVAEVESTDNYSTLTTDAYFAVFEDSVALGGIIAAAATFAVFDVIAAAVCIALLIVRRRKVEQQFRNMVRKELGRR